MPVARLELIWKECAQAVRSLRHEPGFTLVSVLLLAVGIGLTSAVFTLLWQVVYAQLPVPDCSLIFNIGSAVVARNGQRVNIETPLATIAAGTTIGLLPAVHAARVNASAGLAESRSSHSASRSRVRTRRALAATQIAVSLALLIVAGLFAKSLHALTSVPVGFNPDHLTVFSVDPKLAGTSVNTARVFYANIERALQQIRGVQSVAYGTGGPFPQGMDALVLVRPGSKQESGAGSLIGPR